MVVNGLAPLDRLSLAYALFVAGALPWKGVTGADAALQLLAALTLAAVAGLAPWLRKRGGAAAFCGDFYPLLALFALYQQVGAINRIHGLSFDLEAQALEAALFGGQPSRTWMAAAPWPWLSTLLHGGYLSYYLILAAAPLVPWAQGNRAGARRVVTAVMAAFYACYVVFLLLPVAGPRYVLPPVAGPAAETALAQLTHRLLEGGSAWGTAFPSSHVAASLVASVAAFRESRPLGVGLGVLSTLLAFGTVYGGFHYLVDALAGLLVGALALLALRRLRLA